MSSSGVQTTNPFSHTAYVKITLVEFYLRNRKFVLKASDLYSSTYLNHTFRLEVRSKDMDVSLHPTAKAANRADFTSKRLVALRLISTQHPNKSHFDIEFIKRFQIFMSHWTFSTFDGLSAS